MAIENPPYIPLADVPDLPALSRIRMRRKISLPTVVRWWRVGIKTSDGGRVFLRVMKVGGLPATTQEWLDEFFEASAVTRRSVSASSPPPAVKSRVQLAQHQLKKHGM